jgi:uncharacterized protein YecE (DUF72 family)
VAKTFLGTSGWSYDDWVGPIYPNRSTPKLKYYSSIFRTVEIDSTFYAYPKKEMAEGWVKNTPVGFKFSPKLPQIITHEKKLKNAESYLIQFLDLIKPLSDSDKLGVVLIQLPPSFKSQLLRSLENFLQLLPSDIAFAVEFRDKSCEEKQVHDLLERYKVTSVITDSPLELKTELTSDLAFVRYHGRGKKIWYDYKYSEEEIGIFAKKLEEIQNKSSIVYGYFNNHYGGDAVENALQMIQITGSLSSKQLELLNRFKSRCAGLDLFH